LAIAKETIRSLSLSLSLSLSTFLSVGYSFLVMLSERMYQCGVYQSNDEVRIVFKEEEKAKEL